MFLKIGVILTASGIILLACACRQTGMVPTPSDPVRLIHTLTVTITPAGTVTPTYRPTSTKIIYPSVTTWPSPTPKPTSSAEGLLNKTPRPTATPLVPSPNPAKSYRLVNWTPEDADQLIHELETIREEKTGVFYRTSYATFQFSAFAESEAILRFPQASQVKVWKWGEAYNRFQGYEKEAVGLYASLIASALNAGETTIQDFPAWFSGNEPRLDVELEPIATASMYDASYIITISDDMDFGGSYIWLIQIGKEYSAFPMPGEIEYFGGQLNLVDVTGDGIPEAIVQKVRWQSFTIYDGDLTIYDLSRFPPEKLGFNFLPRNAEVASIKALIENQIVVGISLGIPVGDNLYECFTLEPTWYYEWTGAIFELVRIEAPSYEEMAGRSDCADFLINKLFRDYSGLNLQPVMSGLDLMLDNYPYSSDPKLPTHDQLRFDLGLKLAYQGRLNLAREQFHLIISSPEDSDNDWTILADLFLETFNKQTDLFNTCMTLKKCYPYLEVDQLVALIPVERFPEIINILGEMGVPTIYSGRYDFAGDDTEEVWLFTYTPGFFSSNFWIFTPLIKHIEARFIGRLTCQAEFPEVNIIPVQIPELIPAFYVSLGKGDCSSDGIYYDWPADKLSYHSSLTNYGWLDTMNTPDDNIYFYYYTSDSPDRPKFSMPQSDQILRDTELKFLHNRITAWETLNIFRGFPFLLDERLISADRWSHFAEYVYLTGLAYEIVGDSTRAAQMYYQVWSYYPNSPYAVMAMHKLDQD